MQHAAKSFWISAALWMIGVVLTGSATGAAAEPLRRLFAANGRYLVVEALDDDLVHFELASGRGDAVRPVYSTPMVAKTDYPGPSVYRAQGQTVETAELKVTVADDLCVTVFDLARQRELHRICPDKLESAWKGLKVNSPTTRNVYGLGQYFSEESSDGDWLGRVWDPLYDGFGARLRSFAGGANNYSVFPIMYALGEGKATWALFLDQVYKQMWDFRTTPWQIGMWGDQIRWYILSGPDLPDLRRDYLELTGRPPVPPRRSFGLWVSEFGFGNWSELRKELAYLRERRFPVDGFALDLQWFGGSFGEPDRSKMGTLRFDAQAFPDAAGEIARLKDEGVRLMLIEEPYVSSLLEEHSALAARGYLARACASCAPTFLNYNPWWGRGGMVDFTNPAASDFWHDYRRQDLYDLGITDHWADLGEPEQYDARSWYYGFPELGKHAHADVHNVYAFRWMEGIARGYRRNTNERRPFLLSRSGTSGIQRFGAAMWSGDIGTNWGNLRSQMNAQMHMSLSGMDYYGSDIGGFQRSRGGVVGGTEALYTQWFAASAALDVPVRPHAWNIDKLRPTSPARRGDEASNLANLRLRYRLAPYYYSLAHLAHRSGDPVFPPLVHYFQDDSNVRRLGSEKMIGKDLLVALVASPDETRRSVYLPRGRWIDFHSSDVLDSSGQWYDRAVVVDGRFRLPLFARSGAIIPMMAVDDATLNVQARGPLIVRVYPDERASSFDLYEDDGETYAYESGGFAVTTISQAGTAKRLRIVIGASQGSYAGMPLMRSHEIEIALFGAKPSEVHLGGAALPVCSRNKPALPCFQQLASGFVQVQTGPARTRTEKLIEIIL